MPGYNDSDSDDSTYAQPFYDSSYEEDDEDTDLFDKNVINKEQETDEKDNVEGGIVKR